MDSGYYAGRPPQPCDLDSSILELFYRGIKKDAGADAARNFVRFVNKLNDLSASSFIVAFEQFCASGCKTIGIEQNEKDRIRVTGHGDTRDVQAFAVVMESLARGKKSEDEIRRLSNGIKFEFIITHQKEIPANERREVQFAYDFA